MFNITVLSFVDRISCFYSLSPFFNTQQDLAHFTWTDDSSWCLTKDTNTILIMMRQFIKPDIVDLDLMKKLRSKYQRIAFFHDDAGGGIPRLEVLPFVDLFYTKALFKDRSLYQRSLYGKELYSDYYHTKFGITDPDARDRPVVSESSQLDKLRLSWNIGVGEYPRQTFRQRVGVALSRKTSVHSARFFYHRPFPLDPVHSNRELYPVHARLGLISRPSISYQRSLILEKIAGNPDFLTGMVKQSQFNRETAHSKIVLSPFGWGELCLRDFETVRSGAMLLKPDMSHLDTWPDVFLPAKTYIPFNWDADDLVDKARWYLSHDQERRAIAMQAADHYRAQLALLDDRFIGILKEICR